jgi:hypothetical protein
MFTCLSYDTVINFIEDSSLLVVRYSRMLQESTPLIINFYSASIAVNSDINQHWRNLEITD